MTRPPREWGTDEIALYIMGKMDMTDELITRARTAQRDDTQATGALYGELADRIEELERELARWNLPPAVTGFNASNRYEALNREFHTMRVRAEKAEAERDAIAASAAEIAKALEGAVIAEKASYFGSDAEKHKRAARRGAIRKATAALARYRATEANHE